MVPLESFNEDGAHHAVWRCCATTSVPSEARQCLDHQGARGLER